MILEFLVEKLLEENFVLKTMNAPRLNKLLRQMLTYFCQLDTTVLKKHSLCEVRYYYENNFQNLQIINKILIFFVFIDISIINKMFLFQRALSWAKERKTMNLRHELEITLMQLYFDTSYYRKAEETANALYKETKKLQDKEKTVKVCTSRIL